MSKDTYNTLMEKDSQHDLPYLGIRLIGDVPSSLKLSKELYRIATNPLSPNAFEVKNITIYVYNQKSVNALKAYLISNGISVLENNFSKDAANSISARDVTAKQINDIVALNYISNVSIYSDSVKESGFKNSLYAQIFPVSYDTASGYIGRNNYSGSVEALSTTDPEMLKRFRNRLVTSTISGIGDMTAHAELTNDVMASGTNFDELDGGIAPATKLIQASFDTVSTLNNYNAGYHPLSINTSVLPGSSPEENSVYNSVLSNWDAVLRSHSDLMFSASSGNSGSATGTAGYPAGWNNLWYQTGGKNSFTVSNIVYPGLLVTGGGGSCGPTNDGRLAPQICTEGIPVPALLPPILRVK